MIKSTCDILATQPLCLNGYSEKLTLSMERFSARITRAAVIAFVL